LSIVCECYQLVIPDDLQVGGNNGIVEIYAPNLNTATRKLNPLHEQIKFAKRPSSHQIHCQHYCLRKQQVEGALDRQGKAC